MLSKSKIIQGVKIALLNFIVAQLSETDAKCRIVSFRMNGVIRKIIDCLSITLCILFETVRMENRSAFSDAERSPDNLFRPIADRFREAFVSGLFRIQ